MAAAHLSRRCKYVGPPPVATNATPRAVIPQAASRRLAVALSAQTSAMAGAGLGPTAVCSPYQHDLAAGGALFQQRMRLAQVIQIDTVKAAGQGGEYHALVHQLGYPP